MSQIEGLAQLPHSIPAEQSVLGAILLSNSALDAIENLSTEDFYAETHREIHRVIMELVARGQPADLLTVGEALRVQGGSRVDLNYLQGLLANTPSVANVRAYAKLVRDTSRARGMLAAAQQVIELANAAGPIEERLDAAHKLIAEVAETSEIRQPRQIAAVIDRHLPVLDARGRGDRVGLSFGHDDLDRSLPAGMQPGDFIIVAGRPSMGKSVLGFQIADENAKAGHPTLFLSHEMSEGQLADRFIARRARIDLEKILTGNLDNDEWDKIAKAREAVSHTPLWLDESPAMNAQRVRIKARAFKRRHGLELLVVDYLQLMAGRGENRNSEIEEISRGLKGLAKELGIVVIALSQLSRRCEERTNKRPMLSDLRDGGSIEQDADTVLMIYADEVYNPDSTMKGLREIIRAKVRQGRVGTTYAAFLGAHMRMEASTYQPGAAPAPERRYRGYGADDA